MANYLFSTGKLYVRLYDADEDETDMTDADVVAAVQNANFNPACETKEMREASVVNLYPVDDVNYDWSALLSVETGDLNDKLIEYCTGATRTVGGGKIKLTHNGKSKPKYVAMMLVGELSDGRAAVLYITRGKGPGMPLGMKRDDYTMPSVEFRTYPVDGDSDAWTLTIDEA